MASKKEIKKPNLGEMRIHPSFPMPGNPMQQQPIELSKPDPSYGQSLGDLYNN